MLSIPYISSSSRPAVRGRALRLRVLAGWVAWAALLGLYGFGGLARAATGNVQARLVAETAGIAAGQSIGVALEFDIRDGWHTYWRNPGDSGQATTLTWHLPPGFTTSDLVWPTPHRFDLPPLVNYGYAKHAVHLLELTAPKDLRPGSVRLTAKASWLVCSDVCIPEDADLVLDLPVTAGPAPIDPSHAALFAAARRDLPAAAPAAVAATLRDGHLVLSLGRAWGGTLARIESLAFVPYVDGTIEYTAPQTLSRDADGIRLTLKAGDRPPTDGRVEGVLFATERSGDTTLEVPMEISAPLTAGRVAGTAGVAGAAGVADAAAPAAPSAADAPGSAPGLASLLGLALLGGLVLNLMPCVFPVLSIKALGLVEQARKHPAAVRAKGLVFAAGVISSMLSLALALLILRAGGEQIGWGFQLQSPLFITMMVYLLLAVGLNLSGVFEVGGRVAGIGDGLTQGDGYRASFFTGVLTTLVATPCTAPFMAAAVGAALTQSPLVALLIFTSLGLGLALPYLILSFAPWTRRMLPRPGTWMETMKQVFAFPMYASAAWLLWVLAQQTSSLGLAAALGGAVLVAFAAWAYQKSKFAGHGGRVIAKALAAAALLCAVVLPVHYAGTATAAVANAAADADGWQPYDEARAQSIQAEGRPLLINFTASWCLTCLVNERNAFADPKVRALFRDKGVTLMKGDWTNRDPAVTRALSAYGRAGVPLYLLFDARPGSTQAQVLPQLLTAGVVEEALANLPHRDLK